MTNEEKMQVQKNNKKILNAGTIAGIMMGSGAMMAIWGIGDIIEGKKRRQRDRDLVKYGYYTGYGEGYHEATVDTRNLLKLVHADEPDCNDCDDCDGCENVNPIKNDEKEGEESDE